MALSYKNDEAQDSRLNPAETDLRAREQSGYETAGIDQLEAFANDPANATNLNDAEKKGLYRPSAYAGKATDRGRKLSAKNIRAIIKKRGILGLIATILLGGGAAGVILFSPGIAIVHLKETFTKDLNDQLATLTIREEHVFKSKLKGLGACATGSGIRCKFNSFSGKSITNLKNAKIEVECAGGPCKEGLLSRNKITKMTFPDGAAFSDATAAIDYAKKTPSAGSALRRAYNPLYRGFSDSPALTALLRLKATKANILTGKTTEENDKIVIDDVKNGVNTSEALLPGEATDKKAQAASDQTTNDLTKEASTVEKTGTKALSSLESGVSRTVGIIGLADSACTVYRTGVAIEAGAKAVRAFQLARFAMIFLSLADAIKAGTATPEQATYAGNILTAVDTNKTVTIEGNTVDNPNYNKSAFDSNGWRVGAYNEAPKLTASSLQYTVGGTGGLLGALRSINGVADKLQPDPDTVCNVVQNGFVRVGSLIVGIVAGAFSGGASIALNVGGSVAFSIALAVGQQMLTDLLAGTAVDKNTVGAQAGDAIWTGSAVVNSQVAQVRGLSPLTFDGVKQYTVAKAEVNDRYMAMDKYDAKQTPFDIHNQYTFVGSIATNLATAYETSGSNPLSLLGTLVRSPLQTSNAHALADTFNPDRYTQCDDGTYKKLGLAPDVFCNLRFGLSPTELNMDTNSVVDYMINNKYIDETTGDPVYGTEYNDYITNCPLRTDPIGSYSEEGATPAKKGQDCYNQDPKFQNFRVYMVDKSASEGVDGDAPKIIAAATAPTSTVANTANATNGTGTVGSVAMGDDYPYGKGPIDVASPLGYLTRECVDFVAWRLNKQSGITSEPFSNKFKGFGNAVDWYSRAQAAGFRVDQNPTIGSVAWWGAGVTAGGFSSGALGHVAIVSAKNADGSITIEQYNVEIPGVSNYHEYSKVTIRASDISRLYFIHMADVGATNA